MPKYTFRILDGAGVQVASEVREIRFERQALSDLRGVLDQHASASQVDVWREDEALFRYSRRPAASQVGRRLG